MESIVVRRLLRRWYLVAAGLLASVGLGLVAAHLTPPTYQATGTVLLLPPRTQVTGDGLDNPFLQMTTLDAPASFVMDRVNASEARDRIHRDHPSATYLAGPDVSMRGPVVMVTVTDTSASGAMSTLRDVLDLVPESLKQLQRQVKVAKRETVTSMPLASDDAATPITKATDRARLAGFGIGMLGTLGGTIGLDILLCRRAAKKEQADRLPEGPDDDADDDTDDSEARYPRGPIEHHDPAWRTHEGAVARTRSEPVDVTADHHTGSPSSRSPASW